MAKKKFPTFAVIVLIFALIWFLKDLKIINIDVPWIPLLLLIFAAGWIINHYFRD